MSIIQSYIPILIINGEWIPSQNWKDFDDLLHKKSHICLNIPVRILCWQIFWNSWKNQRTWFSRGKHIVYLKTKEMLNLEGIMNEKQLRKTIKTTWTSSILLSTRTLPQNQNDSLNKNVRIVVCNLAILPIDTAIRSKYTEKRTQ